MFPCGYIRPCFRSSRTHMFPNGNNGCPCGANPAITSRAGTFAPEASMPNQSADRPPSDVETAASAQAKTFGALVRERREALKMRQDDLALATGVGRRFILELEAGKQSCQLGRSLVVAAAVGLRPFDLMSANNDAD